MKDQSIELETGKPGFWKIIKKIYCGISQVGILETFIPLCSNWMAVLLYRISHALYRYHVPELPYLFYYINSVLYGCEIHYKTKIGKRFIICHSHGIVIGRDVIIGNGATIYSGVTIGKKDKHTSMPVIGDNVTIGSGAKILGDITIGNNVVIGANSVVIKDVPDNVVVAGVPAKKIVEIITSS